MRERYLTLVNCRTCDDILRPVAALRTCECGAISVNERDDGGYEVTGRALLLKIPWRQYDAAEPGAEQIWTVAGPT
jgi:hypothetical protein